MQRSGSLIIVIGQPLTDEIKWRRKRRDRARGVVNGYGKKNRGLWCFCGWSCPVPPPIKKMGCVFDRVTARTFPKGCTCNCRVLDSIAYSFRLVLGKNTKTLLEFTSIRLEIGDLNNLTLILSKIFLLVMLKCQFDFIDIHAIRPQLAHLFLLLGVCHSTCSKRQGRKRKCNQIHRSAKHW